MMAPHHKGFKSAFRWLSTVALVFLVFGCASEPEYKRPDTLQKEQWSDNNIIETVPADTIKVDWWRNFNDPYLDQLIEQAINNNPDLRILTARIGVAEAAIGRANAARLPTIDAAVGANFEKTEGLPSRRSFSQSAALGWEVDIWGRLKKGVKAQAAEFRATEADWRAGLLTLVSSVSTTYFQIRQFDEQLDRQQQSIEKNQYILSVSRALYEEGLAAETQVMQQEAELIRLRTDLAELQRLRKLSENTLAALLGKAAGDYAVPTQYLSDTVDLIDVPGGLPSQLLSRRPDIVAAEYRVLQAHELQGQARLAKLPGISLTANTGSTSTALTSLLSAFSFGITPIFSIPIFDPNVEAQLRVSTAQTKVAEEEYRKTVVRAFEEVENALVSLASRREQHGRLFERRDKLRQVTDQIRAQYEAGVITQLEVFESERSLLAAELGLLENHQLVLSDTVELYKALGGGWPPEIIAKRLAIGSGR